jgi:predicted protein tyrosine phosphatase
MTKGKRGNQADLIFVMERAHRAKLQRRFKAHLKAARVICLDIPDDYAFMQPELVALLEKKVGPHLPSLSRRERA